VHHGGIGTTHEALRAGVPMLVVPHGFDQPDNAARVRRLGVAAVLPSGRYRADRAAGALRRLLADPDIDARASAVAASLRVEQGASMAASTIEAAMSW